MDKAAYQDELLVKAIRKLDYWKDVRLSYSSWRNFKQCPFKAVLSMTNVVPKEAKAILVVNFRGQVIHQVMDIVLEESRANAPLLLSDKAFVEAVPVAWKMVEVSCRNTGVAWERGDKKEKRLLQESIVDSIHNVYPLLREAPNGIRLLKLVYENKFSTEKRFMTSVDGVGLTGKIDLRIETPDSVVVVDWKDGKKANTDWRQLAFYGANELECGKTLKAGFLFTSLGEWSWKNITHNRWCALKSEIQDVVGVVLNRQFQAKYNRNLCPFCDYTEFCTEYEFHGGVDRERMEAIRSLPDGVVEWC